jgi:acetyltransferase-like isoleucine patch superfamily enzyme
METKTVFDRLREGEAVNMASEEYKAAIEHMNQTSQKCWKINMTAPKSKEILPLLKDLFDGRFPDTSYITPPFEVDYARQMTFGEHVFINHHLTCMAAGGIDIDDGVMLGPNVQILTDNHDLHDRMVIQCKSVHICRNAWIGGGAIILPGVTIGENAVVGSGAVVTKDVEPNTIVVGNPARMIKKIE